MNFCFFYLAEVRDVVNKFLEKPYQISGLGLGSKDVYYDYIALLHLILIKKGMKKGFCIPGNMRNGIKICKELKLKFAKTDYTIDGVIVPENNSLSKETTDELVKMNTGHGTTELICSLDEKIVNEFSKKNTSSIRVGELEEYPDCCVKQFVINFWRDFEYIAELVGDDPYNVEKIMYWKRDASRSEKIFENLKKIYMEFGEGRKKFPYTMHQACTTCLSDGENSPTGKMNSKWKEICEEEFPELNEEIIKGSMREYKENLWWDQSYEEYMQGYYKEMENDGRTN